MLDTLSLMGAGFLNALSPINLLMMAAGVAMGIVIGCMPGLSAAMGVALMLPMTFTMKAETGLIVNSVLHTPDSGDSSDPVLWTVLLIASLSGIAAVTAYDRKRGAAVK